MDNLTNALNAMALDKTMDSCEMEIVPSIREEPIKDTEMKVSNLNLS